MSLRRNRAKKVNTVVLTGMSDKSQIFQAVFSLFPSLLGESDDISGDASGDEVNINEFFYEGQPPYQDVQVQLKDVISIDSPSYMDLSTEYRCAHCILLVYDPTVEFSLQTLCEHYKHMIFHMNVNARVILIRNNANTRDERVLISKTKESRILETTQAGQLLNDALTQSYDDADFVTIYDLLTPGVDDDISRFFLGDFLEILQGRYSSVAHQNQCNSKKMFCCFPCRKNVGEDYEPFVQA